MYLNLTEHTQISHDSLGLQHLKENASTENFLLHFASTKFNVGLYLVYVFCVLMVVILMLSFSLNFQIVGHCYYRFQRYPSTYCLMQGSCFICSNF